MSVLCMGPWCRNTHQVPEETMQLHLHAMFKCGFMILGIILHYCSYTISNPILGLSHYFRRLEELLCAAMQIYSKSHIQEKVKRYFCTKYNNILNYIMTVLLFTWQKGCFYVSWSDYTILIAMERYWCFCICLKKFQKNQCSRWCD